LIEVSVFEATAERLEGASLAFLESRDTKPFNDAEADLRKSIGKHTFLIHEESSAEKADYVPYQDDVDDDGSYEDDASYGYDGSY
jgi:hypothetical protein